MAWFSFSVRVSFSLCFTRCSGFFLSLLGSIISRKRTRRKGRKKKDREADTERRDDEEKETEEERYILSYTERKK